MATSIEEAAGVLGKPERPNRTPADTRMPMPMLRDIEVETWDRTYHYPEARWAFIDAYGALHVRGLDGVILGQFARGNWLSYTVRATIREAAVNHPDMRSKGRPYEPP